MYVWRDFVGTECNFCFVEMVTYKKVYLYKVCDNNFCLFQFDCTSCMFLTCNVLRKGCLEVQIYSLKMSVG